MRPERKAKIEQVIKNKQRGLTVIMENVDDPHNISAVLRSCDAVGVYEVYILHTRDKQHTLLGKKSSASANKWMKIQYFEPVEKCVAAVRAKYDKILATYLQEDSGSLYETDFCQSVALVFGNEQDGVSERLRNLCDGNFIIPQVGMIQSLNISVACAVSLFEVFRQRKFADSKENFDLSKADQEFLVTDWIVEKNNLTLWNDKPAE